ncbi:MAG TPA: methionyl-tRNA formyltransferase [Gemmatimonadaceae bacterium]|nr:methionyl-tRNA formyltransferase [Gemmatimonadaceae bacterium]
MRVLFWGTPDFATPPLRALLGEGFDVCAVITQPDRPVGRHRNTVEAPPVKLAALEEGLTVLQPERPRGDEFLAALRALEPDISVVVAYGNILPRDVIDLPRRGTLNIHASLLPEYRGAAPIQAAIRDGLAWTGVSIMRMIPKLDAGPVILQLGTTVVDDESYGELALRLSELGAAALIEALALIEAGKAHETPQEESLATYAAKIDRTTTRIDWTKDAVGVARTVRAYDPRPGAFAVHRGQEVKFFGARSYSTHQGTAGEVLDITNEGLVVACGAGAARFLQIQPAGKKRMSAEEWRRGRGVSIGDRFE